MNPLHSQRQQSPAGNLYTYGGQQDDFSTPFNDPNNSFSDPNAIFNQNFNQGYTTDFQSANDNVGDQSFQNALSGHGQYGSYMPSQSDAQAWQNNPYLDTNPYAFPPSVGQSNAFSNHTFNQPRLQTYGNDVNMNYSFNERTFTVPRQNQSSTISPAVIDHSESTIPPSALETSDNVWQDTNMAESLPPPPKVVIPARKAPSPAAQSATPPQSHVSTTPMYPSRPQHDPADIEKGIPAGTTQSGFHIRDVSEFRGSAEARSIKGWIYIAKETFDTNESRLASLPEAPARASINQLRSRLDQSEAAKRQGTARSKLEEKLKKREKKDKSRKKKEKDLLPKLASLAATKTGASMAPDARSNADDSESEEESDSSESDGGSDYDGDSDREDEPSPLPKEKPKDEVGATKYEIMESVWAPSSKRLTNEALKTRFGPWLEIVQRVRKEWRVAPDAKSKAERKNLLRDIFHLTTDYGHSHLVQSLDQLTPLASVVAASVTELVKAERYDDSLIEAIVLLFMKLGTLKWPFIVQTRLNKLLPRVIKGAKGKQKTLAELMMNKINACEKAHVDAEKKPSESENGIKKVESVSGSAKPLALPKEKVVGDVRRASPTGIDSKKISTIDTKKPVSTAAQKKPASAAPGRATLGALAKGQPMVRTGSSDSADSKVLAATSNGAASKEKERTRYVVTKPPSIFSSISASKKPSAAVVATAKPAAKEVKVVVKAEPKPAAKPAPPRVSNFSFSELLKSVDKPKEETKTKKESVDKEPPETEEERKKRLRKESRRHLRVTWQPDDKLCQIKLFDHGLEDEMAHAAADVKDLKDEGRAFKREYRQQHNKMDDLEQDFIKESDDVLDPEATDFGEVGADQLELNVTTRANGKKPVESAEAEEQKKREQGVMIAIYATPNDIPWSPREPPVEPWSGPKQQFDFGFDKTKHDWVLNRSARVMERMNAHRAPKPQTNFDDIMKNLNQFSQTPAAPMAPQQNFPGTSDGNVQSLLAQLGVGGGGSAQQTAAQSGGYDPQAAINLFMSMQQGQTPAPVASQPQATAPAANDLSSILSRLTAMNTQGQVPTQPQTAPMAPQQQQQQQQQQQPPQPQQQQQQNASGSGGSGGGGGGGGGGGDAMSSIDPDILAFLNQYNSGSGQSSQPAAQHNQQPQQQWGQGAANLLGFLGQQQQQQAGQTPAAAPMFGGQWNQQQQQAGGGNGSNNSNNSSNSNSNGANERKRGHDDDGGNNRGKKKKPYFGEPKVPCKYWSKGKCHFGDECTFKHD